MFNFPFMLQVKLPVVDRSNKFVIGVDIKDILGGNLTVA